MPRTAQRIAPEIRRLWKPDRQRLIAFYQKLDSPTRRLRFCNAASDEFITGYAERLLALDTVVLGAFPDGKLRGVAELRGLSDAWPRSAEAALLVEPDWQDAGIGDALLNRMVVAAQNRNIRKIKMMCLRENTRMQHLARRHDAIMEFDIGAVEATLDPPWPTPLSIFEEMYGETRSYLHALFHVNGGSARSACAPEVP